MAQRGMSLETVVDDMFRKVERSWVQERQGEDHRRRQMADFTPRSCELRAAEICGKRVVDVDRRDGVVIPGRRRMGDDAPLRHRRPLVRICTKTRRWTRCRTFDI